jgi:hypothetical protein
VHEAQESADLLTITDDVVLPCNWRYHSWAIYLYTRAMVSEAKYTYACKYEPAIDPQGRTALHIAVMLGRTEIAGLLLEKLAPVSAKTNLGHTPLHFACQYNREECIQV